MPPSYFHSIIGHERALTVLGRMLERGQIPHAFLFVGPHHIGKTLIAKQLMQALGGNVMDVIELSCLTDEKTGKKKTQISVEQVRDACERLALSSMSGGWKIAFIKDANLLSVGAANALLKTLEEPKGKTLFILRAPSQDSLMPTISSRCQVLRFTPVDHPTLAHALLKRGFDKQDAERAASLSFGRPGRALRYLTKSEDRARIDVGVAQASELFSSDIASQIKRISTLLPKEDVNKRIVADQTIRVWQGVMRDAFLKEIGCEELMVYQDVHPQEKYKVSLENMIDRLKKAEEARTAIAQNANPQLVLEHILFHS